MPPQVDAASTPSAAPSSLPPSTPPQQQQSLLRFACQQCGMSLQVPDTVTSAACPSCQHLNVLGDSGSGSQGGSEGQGASGGRQPRAPPGKVLVACSSCAKQLFIPEGVSRFQVRARAAAGLLGRLPGPLSSGFRAVPLLQEHRLGVSGAGLAPLRRHHPQELTQA